MSDYLATYPTSQCNGEYGTFKSHYTTLWVIKLSWNNKYNLSFSIASILTFFLDNKIGKPATRNNARWREGQTSQQELLHNRIMVPEFKEKTSQYIAFHHKSFPSKLLNPLSEVIQGNKNNPRRTPRTPQSQSVQRYKQPGDKIGYFWEDWYGTSKTAWVENEIKILIKFGAPPKMSEKK